MQRITKRINSDILWRTLLSMRYQALQLVLQESASTIIITILRKVSLLVVLTPGFTRIALIAVTRMQAGRRDNKRAAMMKNEWRWGKWNKFRAGIILLSSTDSITRISIAIINSTFLWSLRQHMFIPYVRIYCTVPYRAAPPRPRATLRTRTVVCMEWR